VASPIESLVQKYNPKTPADFENALKEVIQDITLAGLARAKFFDKAAFYGGTALRIFYGLPRFSEDLDFTLLKPQGDFKLQPYFSSVKEVLNSFGFEVDVHAVEKSADRKVESAFLKANTQMHLMKIEAAKTLPQFPSNQSLQIKFEVDVNSPLGFETEVRPLLPPLTASVKILKPSSLFAGKMHAVLFRKWKSRIKGRDFYDLLWYIGQGIPLKLSYLEEKMKNGGLLTPEQSLSEASLREQLDERLRSIDWQNAKRDVANFLRDPQELDGWDLELFQGAAKMMKVES
jgi:predicted nucleotidyltransferase component of viral defense system